MIIYRAVPFLLIAAPPAVLLLAVLVLGGCTVARTSDTTTRARFYSDPDSKAGQALARELDRRAMREELRRVSEEAQR